MADAYMPRAKRSDHCTPEVVKVLLSEFFGGQFDLDPCGSTYSILQRKRQYLINRGEDGLKLPWGGSSYVNPPFDLLREFAAKAAKEYGAGRSSEIVFLMPSRTDTKAWHDYVSSADAVCFWRGRMKFIGEKDPCPFPVALVYWGPRVEDFERVFGKVGMVVRLPKDPLS